MLLVEDFLQTNQYLFPVFPNSSTSEAEYQEEAKKTKVIIQGL